MTAEVDGTFVRVCPECDAEFVPTVEECFDCGATLVTRLADEAPDPMAAGRGPAAPAAADEPPAGWVQIEKTDLDWALELRQRLREAGVECRLARDCASCRPTLGVFVAPADLAAGSELARALYVEKVPEADAAAMRALPTTDRCPACGAAMSERATACPDCGLVLVQPDAAAD